MQWDHRPGTQKLFEISAAFGGWSRQAVIDEIAKCDLVCTNCHIIRTVRRAPWGTKWFKEPLLAYECWLEGAA